MTELETSIESFFGLKQKEVIQHIASLFEKVTISKGDFFLRANKRVDRIAFIESGFIRIYLDYEEKEVTQWISTKGYFITDLASFVFNKPARFNMQALVDTEIYIMSKEKYDQLHELIEGWSVFEKNFITHCFETMENRLFTHLAMSAEERYQMFFTHFPSLFNQVPLHYIASMLGMTPETFSRIRKRTSN